MKKISIFNISKIKIICLFSIVACLIIFLIFSFNKVNYYIAKFKNFKNEEIFSNNNNINKISFNEYEKSIYQKIDFLAARKNSNLKFENKKNLYIYESKFTEYEWYLPLLNYYESNQKPTGFVDEWDDNLIIVSGSGQILQINLEDLKSSIEQLNDLKVEKRQSNITSLIDDENFYGRTWISVKDILINNNDLYLTYTKNFKSGNLKKILIENPEHQKTIALDDDNCYGLSILKANLEVDPINFETFLDLNECVNSSTPEFTAHLVGGRLINFGDSFLLTTGDFRTRFLSQDLNSYFGKILQINKSNKSLNIFSTGHRNPQGLLYDVEKNIILSTEHGPWGGDEINIIKLNKNYGWPISSYGRHYCERITPLTEECKQKYLLYPLHKNHSEFGFEEPIKFFQKSLGISEIIKLSSKFSKNNFSYLVSSLGGDEGRQYYFFTLNSNLEVIDEKKFSSQERVRDIKLSNDNKFIFSIKEDTSKLSVIF